MKNRWPLFGAWLVACVGSPIVGANEQPGRVELVPPPPQEAVDALLVAKAAAGLLPKNITLGCTTIPLPTTPEGETWSMDVFDDFHGIFQVEFELVAWRKQCPSGDPQLLVTLSTDAEPHSIPQLFFVQQDENNFNVTFRSNESGTTWHGQLSSPVTVIPTTQPGPAGTFDSTKEFKLVYQGYTTAGRAEITVAAVSGDIEPPSMTLSDAVDGAWYNPEMIGQGIFVDVDLQQNIVAIGWYTANPTTNEREWYTAVGGISGDGAIMELMRTEGVRFMQEGQGVTTAIGTAEVRFANCNSGTFSYDFEGQSGSVPISKLTSPSGPCPVP